MARHRSQDTLVRDYRSKLRFRLSLAMGRRQWARIPNLTVEEQEAAVQWQRPNDLRVDVVGRRSRARSTDLDINSTFDRPWFVPRGLGDSVRIFGNDFPSRAALHPLASDGPEWYSYSLLDSMTVTSPGAGTLKLYRVEVIPRKSGPSLIAGTMMLDAATAEVVRLTFRYVGTLLWIDDDDAGDLDSTKARRLNGLVNRILNVNADLEYSLQDNRYWMPYRQLIAGSVKIPLVSDIVVPFEMLTTFDNYEINTGIPIEFTVAFPDSERDDTNHMVVSNDHWSDSLGSRESAERFEGGRYEMHRAGADSLRRYAGWGDSLQFDLNAGDDTRIRDMVSDLAKLSETLPDELTGRRSHGINYERFADIARYNRVQGLSLGFGYQVRAPFAFSMLQGTGRIGLSDGRLTGRLSLVRDAPGGLLTISGFREVRELDPFSRNFAIGNSLNALFVAHDNADYYLAEGGGVGFEQSVARGVELTIAGRLERQSSVIAEAQSELNDFIGGSGVFQPNPPVREGWFGGGAIRMDRSVGRSGWTLTADGLVGADQQVFRISGELRQRFGNKRGLSITLRSGIASDTTLPQSLFRAGGLRSVRGFDYGARMGQAFWSVQTDVTFSDNWGFRPVVFLDAGQAARPGDLFSSEPLVGAGIGASLLRGIIRFDLSHPITDYHKGLRFDLVFTAAR
jgi:hypothetical protein